jgi:GTP-binding protein LepA
MDLERERGITIKSHAIQMEYEQNGEKYKLHLLEMTSHFSHNMFTTSAFLFCNTFEF